MMRVLRPNLVRLRSAARPVLVGAALWFAAGQAAEGPTRTAQDYARDLEGTDRPARREAAYQLSRMGAGARVALPQLIQALDDDQQQVWFGAITALANLGPEAEPAIPALLKELENWQPFRKDRQGNQALYRTARALGAIGSQAIPALSNALSAEKWPVRAGAARALGFAGEPARPLTPGLVKCLDDDRSEVREAALETLVGLAPTPVPLLAASLRSAEKPYTRAAAAEALARIGRPAAESIPALNAAFDSDPDGGVRAEALQALARVGLPVSELIPRLTQAARSAEEPVRTTALRTLLLVRPVDTALVPALVADLGSPDPTARDFAADRLADLGPDARVAAGPLIAALRRIPSGAPPPTALVRALGALGEAGIAPVLEALAKRPETTQPDQDWMRAVLRQATPIALPALVGSLSHTSPIVRAGGLEGLSALGRQGRPALRRIQPLLQDPDPRVRAQAWVAAATCGLATDLLLPRVEAGLADPAREVRFSTLEALSKLGSAAKPALPRLVALLEGPDEDLRLPTVRTLGAMGAEADAAVGPLAARLEKSPPELQLQILWALGAIGPASVSALPRMLDLASSPSRGVRQAFLEALGRLGTAAGSSAPVLLTAAEDPDPALRAAALRGLAAVDPGSETTLSNILAGLDHPASEVRQAAAAAVVRLEERGRPAEARLFAMLATEGDRVAAKEALRAIHPTSLPLLLEALAHAEWDVREMAADGLARLGKAASEALPVLERLTREDPRDEVRRASRRASRRIREGN